MATVKILIPGYASADSGGHSCSTITLVQDKNLNMVVDPGTLSDPDLLVEAVKKAGLDIKDINVVFITHAHMDHFRNIGMFPAARTLDFWGWWDGDVCTDSDKRVTDDISMIKTPGHNYDGMTLLVKTDEGTVAICGDIFWKENFPVDDPYASDKPKLEESRKLVLKSADWVIPGHGERFRTGR
jgi:glyoxylase-like metal-dependent hydrolase (beta-lactamase superfamily II)